MWMDGVQVESCRLRCPEITKVGEMLAQLFMVAIVIAKNGYFFHRALHALEHLSHTDRLWSLVNRFLGLVTM
jgi:sulfur carrier protein ThiS